MAFGWDDAIMLAGLGAGLLGGKHNDEPPQNQAMNDLIGVQTQRMRQADPLYQAMLRMAMGLLPTYARGGLAMPGMASPGGVNARADEFGNHHAGLYRGRIAPGGGEGMAGGSGGNADGMPEGVRINGLKDLFDGLSNPLYGLRQRSRADGGGR